MWTVFFDYDILQSLEGSELGSFRRSLAVIVVGLGYAGERGWWSGCVLLDDFKNK